MDIALHKPWTQEQFLSWAENQQTRHEFDGFQPVAMTGGNVAHSRVMRGLHNALNRRLRGGPCEPLGPDSALETVNRAVRYPDALVTCSKVESEDYLVLGVVVVFEVLSRSSGRIDRIIKVREYAAVPSIRRYVILESSSIGLTVMEREGPDRAWRTTVLTNDETLLMPEIGVEIPVSEIYEGLSFPNQDQGETKLA
jgi:Uma2 family endonuclease